MKWTKLIKARKINIPADATGMYRKLWEAAAEEDWADASDILMNMSDILEGASDEPSFTEKQRDIIEEIFLEFEGLTYMVERGHTEPVLAAREARRLINILKRKNIPVVEKFL